MGSQYIDLMTLCHVCHSWQAHVVCEDCIRAFAQPKPRCAHCALPLDPPMHCKRCAMEPSPLDQCIAAVDYGFPWAQCITALKFGQAVGLSQTLARLMRHTPWAEPALEQANRIMPVPLSPQRLQERGFNQTRELARHLGAPKIDTLSLQRCASDHHQVGADSTQRWAQAQDSFWISPSSLPTLRGQRVVLVDDVMTTGATLFAAAHTLRRAGVQHISALVFARTPAPRARTAH